MTEFYFVESGSGRGARTDLSKATVRLVKDRVILGEQVYEGLGKPERLRVEHDAQAHALRLTPGSHSLDGYTVQHRPDSRKPFLRTKAPQRFIPLGEYLPISNNIYVHENVQK